MGLKMIRVKVATYDMFSGIFHVFASRNSKGSFEEYFIYGDDGKGVLKDSDPFDHMPTWDEVKMYMEILTYKGENK